MIRRIIGTLLALLIAVAPARSDFSVLGFGAGCFGGNDSFTKLLLHMDGADASTTFTDSSASARSMTAVGNAQIDTAQSVFGGASGLFDGTGDRVTAADSADWDLGSGDWAVDFRVRYPSAPSGVDTIIAQYNGGTNQRSWLFYHDGTNLQFLGSTNGTSAGVTHSWAWTPSTNTQYYVSIVRSGTSMRAFVDGKEIGTADDLTGVTFFNSSSVLTIGDSGDTGQASNFWLDEVRLTKGAARWQGPQPCPYN